MKKIIIFTLFLGLMVSCEKKANEPEMNYPQPEEFPTKPTEESTPSKPNVPSGTTPSRSQYIKNGALPGVFYISETKAIHFSQGNLQYNPKKNEWRFAEQQYVYTMNESYSNITTKTDAWYCLFCWGQSGYNGCSITSDGYPASMLTLKSIAGTNYDWGIYNSVSNGGNKAGLWFCMSSDEWNYLLVHCKHAYGKVNNTDGVFLIPEGFICPENIPLVVAEGENIRPSNENASYTNFSASDHLETDNVFTTTQLTWLESAGIVFLPEHKTNHWYMTTTGSPSYNDFLFAVTLSSASISWGCYGDPKNGRYCVRLVQSI